MRSIQIVFVMLLLSSISVLSSDAIFTNIDGKKFRCNEGNCKFVAIPEMKNQFVNLNNVLFVYNGNIKKWEKLIQKESMNFYCENSSYLNKLLIKLNLTKDKLIQIETFGKFYSEKYYYDLPENYQSGIIILKNK